MRKRLTEHDKTKAKPASDAAAAERAWQKTRDAYQLRIQSSAMRANRHRGRG